MLTAVAVGVVAVLEATVGEPSDRHHPVAWLGRLVAPVDREWSNPRVVGTVVAITVPLAGSAVVALTTLAAAALNPWLGVAFAGLALFVTTSLRILVDEARAVVELSATDLPVARQRLLSLAGRDATDLSAGQVRSAAVESAAENLADGLVAPLGAFTVVAILAQPLGTAAVLALATGAAAWVKAVNTLDSMLGYRSKPVGWAPARLDDVVMWLPARTSALLLAVASGRPGALARARPWLDGVPSPNSGWPIGVLAAASDVRLEKPGVYRLNPEAELPSVETAHRSIRTVAVAGVLAYALAAGALVLAEGILWS